jgi:hypothetical protein
MSEFQFYEFVAIDRPLSARERKRLSLLRILRRTAQGTPDSSGKAQGLASFALSPSRRFLQ